jgi:hypothetical protein
VSYPLLLDEMLSGHIADALRSKGHDVLAVVADSALLALPDDQILAHARGQLGQQPVQPAHRLGALRDELLAPVTQQPQAHRGIVTGHWKDAGTVQGRQTDRDRVVFVGLAAMPAGVHPHPGSQLGRHIHH